VTYSSGSQYNFGPITGNVAAGSTDVTQNYSAGFDITKVREFADLVTEIGGLLGLEDGQQAVLSAATSKLHDAIEDPKADKGRMRRAVDAVVGGPPRQVWRHFLADMINLPGFPGPHSSFPRIPRAARNRRQNAAFPGCTRPPIRESRA